MTRTTIAALALSVASFAPTASAAPMTTFDANVGEWSSATVPVPGVILPIGGSGQVNGNFTLTTDTALPGAEVALRANRRFSPVPLDNVGANYFVETGESSPGLPLWNYDIHIDLRGTGLSFGDFTVSFVSSVPNHSTLDLQTALETAGSLAAGTLDGVELYQSSLNPGFFASGIDPFATGVETFALTLTPNSNVDAPTLGVDIAVTIIPEPATTLLAGLGLAGAGLATRRR